mmetsp:Transcript_36747/g.74961  ORF Transcript_36747/g.74961 Transcript_36747/m.74961 type:complete len:106 (-) Transcript_36747:35-352(-)
MTIIKGLRVVIVLSLMRRPIQDARQSHMQIHDMGMAKHQQTSQPPLTAQVYGTLITIRKGHQGNTSIIQLEDFLSKGTFSLRAGTICLMHMTCILIVDKVITFLR